MDDSFLNRWSRLKRGADAAPAEPLVARAETDSDALTEEEIAALPDINTLTADSDVTGFMRKGVPRALRNAALRRMWTLDPAIRDFVGPARDYAYDWNHPGGVPGSGLLEPGAATAMLRAIFGDEGKPAPAAEAVAGGTADNPQDRPADARLSANEEDQDHA